MAANTLYYGDNLDILRRYVKDESVDLVYLDQPFDSQVTQGVRILRYVCLAKGCERRGETKARAFTLRFSTSSRPGLRRFGGSVCTSDDFAARMRTPCQVTYDGRRLDLPRGGVDVTLRRAPRADRSGGEQRELDL